MCLSSFLPPFFFPFLFFSLSLVWGEDDRGSGSSRVKPASILSALQGCPSV